MTGKKYGQRFNDEYVCWRKKKRLEKRNRNLDHKLTKQSIAYVVYNYSNLIYYNRMYFSCIL